MRNDDILQSRRCTRGFTLVELIVVIVVLGIMAGVAVPKFYDHANRARMTAIIAHTNSMYTAISQYELNTPGTMEVWTVSTADYAASPLVNYFHDNPFTAFNGNWGYNYEGTGGTGVSYIFGVFVMSIGTFPAAGHTFMQLADGTAGTNVYDPGDGEFNAEHNGVYGRNWSILSYPWGFDFSNYDDPETLFMQRSWTK